MGVADRIKELEDELRKTQYNKATEHHFGVVKARIAKLREKLEQESSKKGGGGGFSVRKSGDATVILVGFPSVGKSTLLNKLTGANSKVGQFAFTTLDVVPGVLHFNHATIQVLDVPGILQGASRGKGRGKEVLGTVQSADLVVVLVDALHPECHDVIRNELHDFGVRLNQRPPDVKITKKGRGGISISSTVPLTKMREETIVSVLREFRINNADVLFRDDVTVDQFIDAIKRNRKYCAAVSVVSKIDLLNEEQQEYVREIVNPDLEISAETGLNINALKRLIYDRLQFIRVYLKERNKPADLEEPMIVQRGATIGTICDKIHRSFRDKFKLARMWGSSKFAGQIIRKLDKPLEDGDILEIHLR
ncbi:GTP-binding protein [Candidatus Woesearchaeota archaeon]|nr:GTP-binding protein [Candidatus Woesearchaeota archaeon]